MKPRVYLLYFAIFHGGGWRIFTRYYCL